MDFLSAAVLNRSVALIDGFCILLESGNYLCAAPLVRLQLDSVMRFYGAFLVDDPHTFVMNIMEGAEVRDLKDRDGKRMTDRYLVDKIAEHYPWMPRVYKTTCGLIHLSEKHIYHSVREVRNDDTISMFIGRGDDHVPPEIKIEAIEPLDTITDATFNLVANWAVRKNEGTAAWRERDGDDPQPEVTP